jgi:hypothetical protein
MRGAKEERRENKLFHANLFNFLPQLNWDADFIVPSQPFILFSFYSLSLLFYGAQY